MLALELRFLPPTWSVDERKPCELQAHGVLPRPGREPGSSPPCWAPRPGAPRDTHRNEGCRQQSLPFISQSHFKSWLFDRPKDATHIYLVTNCFLKSLHRHLGFWCKRPFVAQHCQTELLTVKLLSLTNAWWRPNPFRSERCSSYLTSHTARRSKLLFWIICPETE